MKNTLFVEDICMKKTLFEKDILYEEDIIWRGHFVWWACSLQMTFWIMTKFFADDILDYENIL